MPPSSSFSVDRVADLARLSVDGDSREKTVEQMTQILNLIDVLDELDLESVEPFFGMSPIESNPAIQPKRADVVQTSIDRDKILENAPDQDGQFYRVPPVFE